MLFSDDVADAPGATRLTNVLAYLLRSFVVDVR
jgi:hypothetical protein